MITIKELINSPVNDLIRNNEQFTRPMIQKRYFDHFQKPPGFDDLPFRRRQAILRSAVNRFNIFRTSSPLLACAWAHNDLKAGTRVALESVSYQKSIKRCKAKTRRGARCKHKPINDTGRCKYHGGMSTGAKTIEGKIKALSSLKQYKARPDLLESRIAKLRAESVNAAA